MIFASEYDLTTGIFTGSRQGVQSAAMLPPPSAGCGWLQTGWYDVAKWAVDVATGLVIARSATPAATVTLADAINAKLDELSASSRGIRARGVALAAYGVTVPTDDASMARLGIAAQAAPLSLSATMNINLAGQWVGLAAADVPTIYQLACAYCQQVTEVEYSLATVVAGSVTVAAAQAVDVTVNRIQWPLPTIAYTPKPGNGAPIKRTTIPVRGGII